MNIEISQVISQIIAFLIMLWVLKRYAWKPLLESLDKRRDHIAGEFASIEKQKADLKTLEDQYQKQLDEISQTAKEQLRQQIEKGKHIASQLEEDAQLNAKEIINKAKLDIDREIIKAKAQLKEEMVSLIISSAEKVLNEELKDPNSQKKLVENLLEEAKIQ